MHWNHLQYSQNIYNCGTLKYPKILTYMNLGSNIMTEHG